MSKPVAEPDNVTKEWWDATRHVRLLVQRCHDCGHHQLYPRSVCTSCFSQNLGSIQSKGTGTVYSYTTVHRAPHPAFEPPYIVALVRLDEGPLVMCNLWADSPRCDQRVAVVWEELPDGRRLPQFITVPPPADAKPSVKEV